MIGTNTHRAPSPRLVISHFLVGGLAFLLVTLLLLFSLQEMGEHYFHPAILGITHLAVLGWITTVIFGSLYQLVPVILQGKLYSEKLAYWTLGLLFPGALLMTFSFWGFHVGAPLQIGGGMVLFAVILFAFNIFLTIQSGKKRIQSEFIGTAVIWLLITVIVGFLLVLNLRYPFIRTPHLEMLKMHAHFGMFGWFLLLIIGVGSELLPMFMISKGNSEKPLAFAFYAINFGVVLMAPAFILNWGKIPMVIIAILILSGIGAFGKFLYKAYKKRLRKELDIGMRTSFTALLFGAFPVIFGIHSIFFDSMEISIAYGTSILLGVITFLILGQTYKTLPFIVWLSKYRQKVGKEEIPQPADLYSKGIASSHFWTFTSGLLLTISGLILSYYSISLIGGVLLLVTAILYERNMLRIVFQKPRIYGKGKNA